jgi:hypothetical protein
MRGSPVLTTIPRHRPGGAILVTAQIRLTGIIGANTVVGAKHPILVVP